MVAPMISDPWIDRDPRRPKPKRVRVPKPKAPRVYRPKTSAEDRLMTNLRRAELAAIGKCINGPKTGDVGIRGVVHGPVYMIDRAIAASAEIPFPASSSRWPPVMLGSSRSRTSISQRGITTALRSSDPSTDDSADPSRARNRPR
jgi:hypothetical protein